MAAAGGAGAVIGGAGQLAGGAMSAAGRAMDSEKALPDAEVHVRLKQRRGAVGGQGGGSLSKELFRHAMQAEAQEAHEALEAVGLGGDVRGHSEAHAVSPEGRAASRDLDVAVVRKAVELELGVGMHEHAGYEGQHPLSQKHHEVPEGGYKSWRKPLNALAEGEHTHAAASGGGHYKPHPLDQSHEPTDEDGYTDEEAKNVTGAERKAKRDAAQKAVELELGYAPHEKTDSGSDKLLAQIRGKTKGGQGVMGGGGGMHEHAGYEGKHPVSQEHHAHGTDKGSQARLKVMDAIAVANGYKKHADAKSKLDPAKAGSMAAAYDDHKAGGKIQGSPAHQGAVAAMHEGESVPAGKAPAGTIEHTPAQKGAYDAMKSLLKKGGDHHSLSGFSDDEIQYAHGRTAHTMRRYEPGHPTHQSNAKRFVHFDTELKRRGLTALKGVDLEKAPSNPAMTSAAGPRELKPVKMPIRAGGTSKVRLGSLGEGESAARERMRKAFITPEQKEENSPHVVDGTKGPKCSACLTKELLKGILDTRIRSVDSARKAAGMPPASKPRSATQKDVKAPWSVEKLALVQPMDTQLAEAKKHPIDLKTLGKPSKPSLAKALLVHELEKGMLRAQLGLEPPNTPDKPKAKTGAAAVADHPILGTAAKYKINNPTDAQYRDWDKGAA